MGYPNNPFVHQPPWRATLLDSSEIRITTRGVPTEKVTKQNHKRGMNHLTQIHNHKRKRNHGTRYTHELNIEIQRSTQRPNHGKIQHKRVSQCLWKSNNLTPITYQREWLRHWRVPNSSKTCLYIKITSIEK